MTSKTANLLTDAKGGIIPGQQYNSNTDLFELTSPTNPAPTVLYDANGDPVVFTGTAPVINTSPYPSGATAINATSGNAANATATATLAGAVDKITYIAGFTVHGGGATAASLKTVTVGGLAVPMTYTVGVVAGATVANTPINVSFNPPIAASAANTAITVTCDALGSGNTANYVNAYGYQL